MSIQPSAWPAMVRRATQFAPEGIRATSSGFPALDSQLPGGGWPHGVVTELIARESGIGELRLLIPLLRQLTLERRFVILLGPPHQPYAPALASFGINLDYLIIVQATQAADRLWAVEQSLRSASFGALLAWLPQARTRPEHIRRFQMAAQGCSGPAFLFRELPAQLEASAAPLRLLLLPRPEQQISVQILKRRGPVMAQPLILNLPHPPATLHPRHWSRPGRVPLPARSAERTASEPTTLHSGWRGPASAPTTAN